ncbi:hypothetical protein ACQ86N_28835 [Puia sp. P3]|uniref:hypothetical protein n=1 Tax=Puia sp. P3 TaxID=3423952 RepID=UPI003D6726E4
MYANIFIPLKRPGTGGAATGAANEGVWVPAAALVGEDQLTGIYTVSNMHTALLRWVRTGKGPETSWKYSPASAQTNPLSPAHPANYTTVSR